MNDDADADDDDVVKDATLASWSWAAASLLGAWSSALIFFPRALLFAAEEGQTLTPLEGFLALHFGILLAAVSLALILNIPSAQPIPQRLQHTPPSHPLLVPLTSVALLSAFLSYNTRTAGSLPFLFSLCTGTVGIWGLWAVIFAGPTRVSHKTGADKHTSAFIFGNKAAASVQKRYFQRKNARGPQK
ncbi:hypothetical protein HETIRDRAFT_311279 [Heterobasidion irregulare TC 32-1]|uniref:Uncharacterized protein n=1 Tax=Heterobasidion irregulare (strain TC 32-1) TaxID=747525 RepID=W4KKL4_HETIT|nr:uncharacterized protein HETIRDRAFT_311279 [Heterobasidion irregulare TC 32-1]ETW85880.1 hypothetical protein HETIRDRAFT_311279 [Heterobasidion irregulare TC 32-1]